MFCFLYDVVVTVVTYRGYLPWLPTVVTVTEWPVREPLVQYRVEGGANGAEGTNLFIFVLK